DSRGLSSCCVLRRPPPVSTLCPYTTLFRSEDGCWTLVISTGDDTAAFTYDVQDRYVLPGDQNSRDLVGDIAGPDSTDTALADALDRKSTRLNSSHVSISYAVFCLKKKRHYT